MLLHPTEILDRPLSFRTHARLRLFTCQSGHHAHRPAPSTCKCASPIPAAGQQQCEPLEFTVAARQSYESNALISELCRYSVSSAVPIADLPDATCQRTRTNVFSRSPRGCSQYGAAETRTVADAYIWRFTAVCISARCIYQHVPRNIPTPWI